MEGGCGPLGFRIGSSRKSPAASSVNRSIFVRISGERRKHSKRVKKCSPILVLLSGLLSVRSKDVSAIYELLYNPKYAPQRSTTSHIEQLTVDGQPAYILMNESTGEYYEVDATTNAIWNLADGGKTVKEIWAEVKGTDDTITEREVRDVIVSLAEEGTIESSEPEVEQKRVELVSTFQLDIHLLKDSSRSLAWFFRLTRKLMGREVLALAIGISILGAVLFASTFTQIFANSSAFVVAGSTLLGLLFYQMVVLLPVYLVHELAHAATCDYYGGKPRELGTGLYYLAPFFYSDTSDSWRLSRRARIMISLAGPLSTVVLASFFVFWSYFLPSSFGRNVLQLGAFFAFYGTLLNFSPVIETDGYYILADVLKIPNLRDESFSYIKSGFLRKLGRPVRLVRRSARTRRIFLVYAGIAMVWLAIFVYTSTRLMFIYGLDAYQASVSLLSMVLRSEPFNTTTVGVNIATLSYFSLLLSGFAVIGAVAYRNIRFRGVKLETIHDKRVSVFLPLPSFFPRRRAEGLVSAAKSLSRKFSRSFSVTWEPPLCVAAIKLGKVDEGLDETRRDMLRVERSFKSLHYEFLSNNLSSYSKRTSSKKRTMAKGLLNLAAHFPPFERREVIAEASEFLKRRDELIKYLLEAAFGTVWTLELSPADYRRIKREIFPGLTAEDLGVTDLHGELEHFKKHTVLGLDAIAQLASEIEEESGKVNKMPGLYQLTAFIEPVKSRLVFVGRTEKVEGSIVWLGGLFLYQAWTGYMGEALDEAALGLRSIRLAPTHSFAKTHIMKLSDSELDLLRREFDQIGTLKQIVGEAMVQLQSTYESALNFRETLNSLMSDEVFDIGLYKPILSTNDKRLANLRNRIEKFHDEFNRVTDELEKVMHGVNEEYSKRLSGLEKAKLGLFRKLALQFLPSFRGTRASARQAPVYEAGIKLLFATYRLAYDVVIASDLVM